MIDPLLIYGATGYSGALVTRAAIARGVRPVLAGRSEAKLAAMAERLGLPYRVAPLDDPDRLCAVLEGIRVVVHGAGPFSATSRPMVDACLRTGAHYLDITGEVGVIEACAARDAEARGRRIMIMPGAGFDVVPSDCLAMHVAARLPRARRLAFGMSGIAVFVTRGSAKTLVEAADFGVVRRGGAITRVPLGSLEHRFDYGDGPSPSLNVSWGDVASGYYTTGVPDIAVYAETTPVVQAVLASSRYLGWMFRRAPWQAWLKACADVLPEGPTEAERAARGAVIVAEAEDERGKRAISRLRTPNSYTFTGTTAAAVADRALAGDYEVGFQTPGRVYGGDFVLSLGGVSREDIE